MPGSGICMSEAPPSPDWSDPACISRLEAMYAEITAEIPEHPWYFVRIVGRRWAFLCGERTELAAAPVRTELVPGLGICIFGRNGQPADPVAVHHLTNRILQEIQHL